MEVGEGVGHLAFLSEFLSELSTSDTYNVGILNVAVNPFVFPTVAHDRLSGPVTVDRSGCDGSFLADGPSSTHGATRSPCWLPPGLTLAPLAGGSVRPLQVRSWAVAVGRASGLARRMLGSTLDDLAVRELTHLGKLLLSNRLLRHQACLNAVEKALKPADELRLGNAEFGFARNFVMVKRQRQRPELFL